jgi:alpha 1,2-mannosyltransferase
MLRPDVHFHCDILFDPFRFMEEHNKIYGALFRHKPKYSVETNNPSRLGFTISMVEYEATIATLWGHVKSELTHGILRVIKLEN